MFCDPCVHTSLHDIVSIACKKFTQRAWLIVLLHTKNAVMQYSIALMIDTLLRASQFEGTYLELASSWHTSVRGKMESPKQSSYVPRSVQDH